MRTKTPCASPAFQRGASAPSFGGRGTFGDHQPGVGTCRANPRLWETSPSDLVGVHPDVMRSAEHAASAEHGAMKPTAIIHTSFRPGPHTPVFYADEAIAPPLCIPSSNTSPEARQPGSCPSPPKGGEGARRADEGGLRVPNTNRAPHQKPTVRERERRSPIPIHVAFTNTRMRTKTPRASPAVQRNPSATSFGGRDVFGGYANLG